MPLRFLWGSFEITLNFLWFVPGRQLGAARGGDNNYLFYFIFYVLTISPEGAAENNYLFYFLC